MMNLIYPTLLQTANTIKSNSWFDIKIRKNFKHKKKKKKHSYNYVNTYKIKLKLTTDQKIKINSWMDKCIDIYNFTNKYIKDKITDNNFYDIVNFYKLRKQLNEQIKKLSNENGLNKHTADYAVKHCVEMYKSAHSNLMNKHIKTFEIKDLQKDRRRKNIVIEPSSVSKSKNSIFIKQLGEINSSLRLNKITKNSILQYDTIKKTYIIISPYEKKCNIELNQIKKCGIDIGVRTFLTVYSPEVTYEIGTNTNKIIDRMNKRLDGIKSNKEKLNKICYNKLFAKYSDKIRNKINDLHNKASKFLLKRFDTILIGKVSTKQMVSNAKGNLREIVKRRLMTLSHYKFRMKLHKMKIKYDNNVREINEYMTSKTCCRCKNINRELKGEKIYECKKCGLKIDRDINASINIYLL